MGSALVIIAQKNYRDEELSIPKGILEDSKHFIEVASITDDPCVGMLGAITSPDLAVRDAHVDDYDAIIVIGGSGSPELAKHAEVMMILKAAAGAGKIVSAICLAPIVLAKAGLLAGKKATVYKTQDSLTSLEMGGAEYVDDPVVIDGKIVTACGPSAAQGLQFAHRLQYTVRHQHCHPATL